VWLNEGQQRNIRWDFIDVFAYASIVVIITLRIGYVKRGGT
jgi:hypothetical protein